MLLGQLSWISHQNELRRFWLTSPSNTSYWILSQWVFVFGRRSEQILRWQLWGPSCISDQSDFSYICRVSRRPPWRSSWISCQTGFSYFDLPATPMFSTKFESFGFSVQKKKRKVDGLYLGFPIRTLFFIYFWFTSHPKASYSGSSQLAFRFRRCEKKFTRWPPCHLRFPIETILPTFNLSVTPMLPAKFRVNFPFASGEEAKNRFSRWSTWWPSWMSNRTILAIIDLQVTPMFPTKFIKSISLSIPEKKQKIAFQNGRHGGHLGFPIGKLLAIFDL